MFFRKKEAAEAASSQLGRFSPLFILVAALAGILLLLLGSGSIKDQSEEPAQPTAPSAQEELATYQLYLENRVQTLCESVRGISDVTVAVTLLGGFEEIYATETVDGNQTYVILGSGSNASALPISHSTPQIAGIGVVCHGGGNTDLRRELTDLLCAAFDVPSNRVYIAEAKN